MSNIFLPYLVIWFVVTIPSHSHDFLYHIKLQSVHCKEKVFHLLVCIFHLEVFVDYAQCVSTYYIARLEALIVGSRRPFLAVIVNS